MLWGTFTTLFQIWIDLRDCAIQLNFNALLLFFLMIPQFNTNLLKFEKKIAALMGYSSWEPRTSVWKVLMRLFWNPAAWLLLQNPLSKENCASFAQFKIGLPLVSIALHSLVQYCCGTSAAPVWFVSLFVFGQLVVRLIWLPVFEALKLLWKLL